MISAAIAAFKLLGFWGSVKHLVGGAFKWAREHPAWALCIALALWGAYERLDAVKAWGRAAEWKQAHDKLIKASDEAKAAQIAVNKAPAAKAKTIAEKSNAEAPAYYRRVADAANANRVRPASCPSGVANLPGADSAAPVNDGPIAAADMVSRSRADDDLIIAAAARAAKMHQDAAALIEAGVAVAGD